MKKQYPGRDDIAKEIDSWFKQDKKNIKSKPIKKGNKK